MTRSTNRVLRGPDAKRERGGRCSKVENFKSATAKLERKCGTLLSVAPVLIAHIQAARGRQVVQTRDGKGGGGEGKGKERQEESRKAKENGKENAPSYWTNVPEPSTPACLHLPGHRDRHNRKCQCLLSLVGFGRAQGKVSHGSQGFAWINSFTPNNPLREMFLRLHWFFLLNY